jgi:2-polyprenyl-3-methyl-5-hydroxy-6-metoxy-1,4-benzoquinol methylase
LPAYFETDLRSGTGMAEKASSPMRLFAKLGAQNGGDLLSSVGTETDHQNSLNVYFEASSKYWTDIYEVEDVDGAIYRQRRSVALSLAEKLALPVEAPILEIGCGSGLTSVQLAREGYAIQAVDSVEAMIKSTRQHAEEAGVGDRVITSVRDVYDLGYPDNSFDLVLKIGVAPWLYSLDQAVREVVRVLRPGGYLITTADNWWRLHHWLDPRYLPPLAPMRRRVRSVLERLGLIGSRGASARLHSIREFDAGLSAAGLAKIEARTVGFGPFSFLGWKLLPDSFGMKVHQRLQDLADRGVPILRSMGTHYVVLARKGVSSLTPPRRSPCVK